MSEQNLKMRAKRYALIIRLLYANQNLSGRLAQVHRGARHLSYGVRLDDPMQLDKALKLAEPMALSAGTKAVMASRTNGLVSYQIQLPKIYWQFYTRQDVKGLEVGLAEQRKPVSFSFDDAPHALFAGTSGSGKTEAVKSAMVALVEVYKPNELQFVVIDTNRELDDFNNVSHLAIPIADEMRQAESALMYANSELAHRKSENIKDCSKLVIVIDEVADLTDSQKNVEALKQLAKQGRKYQIHLLIGNQKPSQKQLPSILDNLTNRFVGQTDSAQTSALLTGHAGLEAHKLSGQGDFLHVVNAQVERFQVAQAVARDFDRLPRSEIKPVTVENDFVELPALPETSAGRPPVELNAKTLAQYFYYNPNRITYELAERLFGQKRTGHILHRDFCLEFAKEYMKLRKAGIKLLGEKS